MDWSFPFSTGGDSARAKGPVARPFYFPIDHELVRRLLNVNHLAAGIEGPMHANFLAFELLDLLLGVDIVSGAASGILKHVLVARFHDRTGEDLHSGLLRLGLGIRCRLC